jgi:predicted AlkP superfamily pyrophosphatase or phosphodiesterase
MIRTCRGLVLACAALALAACANAPRPATTRPLTVLVSIDGFRADYLDRGLTPALSGLAARGARGAMRPSFPSKTYPNHYTLVTGLTPDHHGVVDNAMEDPAIPGVTFRLADRATVTDRRWWDDAVPIWVTAERAGLRTANVFWPGSEAAIHGVRPTDWLTFDMSWPAQRRAGQALAWLDRPPAERPAFVALYFDEVDTEGHRFGPDSAQVNAAIARTDAAIGRLLAGLSARGIAANVMVVADHGMAPISDARLIFADDLLAPDAGRTMALGAFMTYVPTPGREAEVERALIRPHPHMTCWRKGEIPARYHYGSHRRAPPIFCLAQTGWEITTRKRLSARTHVNRGDHGFDPEAPEMRAVFVAAGPDIEPGVRVGDFDNVDVYPLLARLLGVRPEPHDGDLAELRAILAAQGH